jgi:hypothetical protein
METIFFYNSEENYLTVSPTGSWLMYQVRLTGGLLSSAVQFTASGSPTLYLNRYENIHFIQKYRDISWKKVFIVQILTNTANAVQSF